MGLTETYRKPVVWPDTRGDLKSHSRVAAPRTPDKAATKKGANANSGGKAKKK
jgi:hypothetical protein